MKKNDDTPSLRELRRTMRECLENQSTPLSQHASERLRAARKQALTYQKQALTVSQIQFANVPNRILKSLFPSQFWFSLRTLGTVMPILLLASGLSSLGDFHDEKLSHELAEVDIALLTDDLPPQAYSDPHFLSYLTEKVDFGSVD